MEEDGHGRAWILTFSLPYRSNDNEDCSCLKHPCHKNVEFTDGELFIGLVNYSIHSKWYQRI